MKKISARIIKDSVTEHGNRLTTFELTFPRFILAELNTHRVFSRNAASSRAIPTKILLKQVEENPALPVFWGKLQKGMQAAAELTGEQLQFSKELWNNQKETALMIVGELYKNKLHKQLANRLLEPWMWVTDIVTATDFDNFFVQRCSPYAQPEFKELADQMQEIYYETEPHKLKVGEWHLPYIYKEDYADVQAYAMLQPIKPGEDFEEKVNDFLKMVSTSRCARVSYLTHNGVRDIEEDVQMFQEKLRPNKHLSPFEHIATPCPHQSALNSLKFKAHTMHKDTEFSIKCKFNGNFEGWDQFRKEIPGENAKFKPNVYRFAKKKMEAE